MTLYPKLILDALATVRYPGNKKNLVEAEMVADNLRIDGMKVSFSLIFEKPTDPFMKSMVKAAETAIHTYVSPEVEVTIATESRQAACLPVRAVWASPPYRQIWLCPLPNWGIR